MGTFKTWTGENKNTTLFKEPDALYHALNNHDLYNEDKALFMFCDYNGDVCYFTIKPENMLKLITEAYMAGLDSVRSLIPVEPVSPIKADISQGSVCRDFLESLCGAEYFIADPGEMVNYIKEKDFKKALESLDSYEEDVTDFEL